MCPCVPDNEPTNLLTLAQVARRLDVPQPRATAAIRDGVWVPDFVTGRLLLFLETRLADLKARLRASTKPA